MSSIYVNEPPTQGKVLIKLSSIGDLEMELWPKQAPKACRNFLQLALEGYYNGCRFDRVVPKFIAQCSINDAADKDGFGCIYPDNQFPVESHSRLRFTHRGIVGMAADEVEGTNSSPFFITLAETPDLNGYHTIFGKIVGDTVYNLVKFSELEIDKESERPLIPPRILSIEVLNNPFDDIVPRRSPHQILTGSSEKGNSDKPVQEKRLRDVKAVKNKTLLSFEDDFDDDASELILPKTKGKSAHDLLKDDPKLSKRTVEIAIADSQPSKKKLKSEPAQSSIPIETISETLNVEEIPKKYSVAEEIEKMKREIKKIDSVSKTRYKESSKDKPQHKSILELEKEKFLLKANGSHKVIKGGKFKKKDVEDDETLSRLFGFQDKLRNQNNDAKSDVKREWMAHDLKFKNHDNSADVGVRDMENTDDLVVVDPLDNE